MADGSLTPESIIEYWYSEKIKSQWFNSSPELDQEIKSNYENIWREVLRGEYASWSESAAGCLALAIILDQFPLNMFRNQAICFSTEQKSIQVTLNALKNNFVPQIEKGSSPL